MKMKFIDLVLTSLTKLYNAEGLEPGIKLQVIKLTRDLNQEKSIYEAVKEQYIDKYCLKDKDNKRKTFVQKTVDKDILMYDFGTNAKKYYNEMEKILESNLSFEIKPLTVSLENVCNTFLSPKDIDILLTNRIITDGGMKNHGGTKSIIQKN